MPESGNFGRREALAERQLIVIQAGMYQGIVAKIATQTGSPVPDRIQFMGVGPHDHGFEPYQKSTA
jgi:hypothetical protein